jgi:hypothetical protein
VGLLICVAVGALLVGWITGGSLARLGDVPLRGWPLVLGAIAAVIAGTLLATMGGTPGRVCAVAGFVIAAGCLSILMLRNRRVEGVPLMAAGLLLNAVVVGANGAMPVSLYAEARAGVSSSVTLLDGRDSRHEVAGPGTRLRPLGDVIPVPLPWRPETISAGDVLVIAGAGLLILAGMHRRA